MPSLQKQAMEDRSQLKTARDEALKRRRNGSKPRPRVLKMERDIAILWGLYHGWSDDKISDYFFVSTTAIVRARRELNDTPQHIFRTPILHRDMVGNKQVWRCEACGGRMVGTEKKARLHVVDHFGISQSSIRNVGVMDEDLIL